jgi:hypothetical protein
MLELWLCFSENHRWTQMGGEWEGPAGRFCRVRLRGAYGVICAALREAVDVAEGVANAD